MSLKKTEQTGTKAAWHPAGWKWYLLGAVGASFLCMIGAAYAFRPGSTLPRGPAEPAIIEIKKGETLSEIGTSLRDAGVVKFAMPATLALRVLSGSDGVLAGDYVIHPDWNPIRALLQIARGDFGVEPIRITIPEGTTSFEMAEILKGKLLTFDTHTFEGLARTYEGYLFPDTYFFLPTMNEQEVVTVMNAAFRKQIATLSSDVEASKRPLSDVIIVASLLEKEARTFESKQMIAGIIYNRLAINMPLQIDAVFGYIQERDTFNPSLKDLATDSPYNTYTNKSLPPGPIANPGLTSIMAALHPTESKYLYYLTGRDGKMHYAKTFEEHIANRKKYLD